MCIGIYWEKERREEERDRNREKERREEERDRNKERNNIWFRYENIPFLQMKVTCKSKYRETVGLRFLIWFPKLVKLNYRIWITWKKIISFSVTDPIKCIQFHFKIKQNKSQVSLIFETRFIIPIISKCFQAGEFRNWGGAQVCRLKCKYTPSFIQLTSCIKTFVIEFNQGTFIIKGY